MMKLLDRIGTEVVDFMRPPLAVWLFTRQIITDEQKAKNRSRVGVSTSRFNDRFCNTNERMVRGEPSFFSAVAVAVVVANKNANITQSKASDDGQQLSPICFAFAVLETSKTANERLRRQTIDRPSQ